jgi:hypothetical protein
MTVYVVVTKKGRRFCTVYQSENNAIVFCKNTFYGDIVKAMKFYDIIKTEA